MLSAFKRFLFTNIGIRQTILKNTFWLSASEVASRLVGLVLVMYVARVLGATEYGKFTFAFSFTSILAILCELGLSDIATREFSRSKENEKKLGSILGLQLLLALCVMGVSLAGSLLLSDEWEIVQSIWILTLFIITNSFLGILFAFLRSRQKMEQEAGIKFFQSLATLAVVLGVIFRIPSFVYLSYAYLAANALVLLVALAYFHIKFQKISIRFSRDMFEMLSMSWPLSFGLMIGWIYMCLDSVMMGAFGLITENGWYNAALRVSIVALLPASLIMKSFYPALSNFFVSSKENLQRIWNYLMELMILLALPTVAGGIVLADRIIYSLYGAEYAPAALGLRLLMVVIGISFINYPYAAILVVSDRQKRNFCLIIAGAVANAALNIFFIPRFGWQGAIMATIISSALIFGATVFSVTKLKLVAPFTLLLAKVAGIGGVASFAMYSFLLLPYVKNFPLVILVALGAVLYGAVVIVLYKIIFPGRMSLLKELQRYNQSA